MPVWLQPDGVPHDATLRMTVYTNNYVSIDVLDGMRRPINHLSGWYRSHPTFDERGSMCFPMYFYVAVDGDSQLFEQRALERFVYAVDSASEHCTVQRVSWLVR